MAALLLEVDALLPVRRHALVVLPLAHPAHREVVDPEADLENVPEAEDDDDAHGVLPAAFPGVVRPVVGQLVPVCACAAVSGQA